MSEHSMVYLAAAVVFVSLASRLKLGSVLGYLAAGSCIGPWGLRLMREPASTLHFAEIGVVLMLFVIGLELDPKHLWSLRQRIFGSGSVQLGACALPLGLTGFALGLSWQGALVTGLTLALSSTAVAMQTMAEKNLLALPLGRTSFAVLLFQDITAIPLLALVPLLASASPDTAGPRLSAGLRVFAAIAAVFVIGRIVMPRLLRLVAGTQQREVFTALALLFVLGIALLMTTVGISMALGAFVAGVLLASSEYRHALQTDIEPFKGLLMGLFFIAVGMSIDFGLLIARPLYVLGLVVGFQGIKLLVLRAIAGPLGIVPRQRWLFAVLLAQGGEFAFVVFGVARSARLLPGSWDALLTLIVALSMALTPVLLAAHDWLLMHGQSKQSKKADNIDEHDAPVIIAGFGRVGQVVGRLLFASGIKATVLDHDPEQIELLRRFAFKVYYGDATRLDLLQAAGAPTAKVLVVAIDDPEMSASLVDAVREHFPHLSIVARARNVGHWAELRSRGVDAVERETFESSLLLGRRVLGALGVHPYEARERADRFRRHNIAMLEEVLPYWQDEEQRTNRARSAREQLERQMERERADLEVHDAQGWHAELDLADRERS